jgi:hypothetical protein
MSHLSEEEPARPAVRRPRSRQLSRRGTSARTRISFQCAQRRDFNPDPLDPIERAADGTELCEEIGMVDRVALRNQFAGLVAPFRGRPL